MADFDITTFPKDRWPPQLEEINDPPERLFIRGDFPDPERHRFLTIVGSRKYTQYSKEVVQKIVAGLRGAPVVIVSGLALGIDSIAHKAALDAGLPTVSVPGSGLSDDVLYPRSHVGLARDILEAGGALVSEFEPDFRATKWSFPKRNRIMAGMSHAVLIAQATQKSGTMITARLATEYNREVMTVPGSIFSESMEGNHNLIKDGATPITSGGDVLEALHIERGPADGSQSTLFDNLSDDEQAIIDLLDEPKEKDVLIRTLAMPTHKANILLSTLELKGLIVERMGKVHKAHD